MVADNLLTLDSVDGSPFFRAVPVEGAWGEGIGAADPDDESGVCGHDEA